MNDPLDVIFETPEQSLAIFLKSMPKTLIPVFQREFMRRPTTGAVDLLDSVPSQKLSADDYDTLAEANSTLHANH